MALVIICLVLPAFGQGVTPNIQKINTDQDHFGGPQRNISLSLIPYGAPQTQSEAQWDIEYAYDPADSIPNGVTGGTAGIAFNGTDFWVSQWQDDTLHRYNSMGVWQETFTIPTVSATRNIAWDGTNYYLANNSTTIYEVDPTTKMVTGTISAPAAVRAMCYDPTLDGGNGGFWTNFWGTAGSEPLIAISRTGATLATIPFADHGMSFAYGLAYDATSIGGPYLWGFDQSGSGAVIKQFNIASGMSTPVSRDVNADFGANSSAGGLVVIDNHPDFPGQRILGGMLQGTVNFGYDLDFSPIGIDANLAFALPRPGFTFVPLTHLGAIDYANVVVNQGSQTISSLNVGLDITSDGTSVFSDSETIMNVNSNDTIVSILGPWTPADTGLYFIDLGATVGAQADEDNTNDSAFYFLSVNDSVFGRDDGFITGSLGIGPTANDNAILGQNFTLSQTDFMTSVSFFLNAPPTGDVVYASVYSVDANGVPQSLIQNTVSYTITADDNANGVFLTLPFQGNPVGLPAGEFYVGVIEPGDNITLATTTSIFSPGSTWINWDALGGWANSENLGGFEVAYVLRPNFGPCAPLYLTGSVNVDDDDSGTGDATLTANAMGGTAPYTYVWSDPFASTTQTITNVVGGQAYSVTVTDVNGCTQTFTSEVVNQWPTGIEEEEAAGINAFNLFPNPNNGQFDLGLKFAKAEAAQVRVYDITGAIVETVVLPRAQQVNHTFDLSTRAAGIYLIQVQTAQGTATRRVSVR
ncbi:MAG: T9SS type A sorting domain-containing protein [Bacteroidota bacterium]